MIGFNTLLGGALSLGGAIASAVASARASQRGDNALSNAHSEAQKWYDTQLATPYTQSAEIQSILSAQRGLLNDAYKTARANSIVSGGSDASVALQQAAANRQVAQTMSGLASNADANKRSLAMGKMAENQQYANQYAQRQAQRAANIANVGTQAASLGGQIIAGQGEDALTRWLSGKG